MYPGVYAVGAAPLSQRGRWFAALLTSRPGPLLSHTSAAALFGFAPEGPVPHVTIPRRSGRCVEGIALHRVRKLDPEDITRLEEFPVTTVARTLLDLAGILSRHRFEKVLDETDRRGLLDLLSLRRTIDRNPGRRGLRVVEEILADYHSTPGAKEGMERSFQLLLRDEGLPEPQVNVLVHGLLVDCYWPQAKLVVELDSRAFHATWAAREEDLRRDAHLLRHGITTLRVSNRRMSRERHELVCDLWTQLARERDE